MTIRAIDNGFIVVEGSGHYLSSYNGNCCMSFPDLVTAWNFVEQHMISPEDFKKAKAEALEVRKKMMDENCNQAAAGVAASLQAFRG